jgi:hypothetical protein
MNKKIFTAILSLLFVASSMVSAHTVTDTAFIPLHVFGKFQQVIAKVDQAVLRNKVDAYLDQSFNQKLTQIVEQADGSRRLSVASSNTNAVAAIGNAADSSFVIAKKNIDFSSCMPMFPMEVGKDGVPNFSLTGYGFGKNLSSDNEFKGIYFLKPEGVKSVLTEKEYSFFITLMNNRFVLEGDTSDNKKTVEWKVGSKPIGQKEVYQACFNIEKALNQVFDTLMKLGIVPSSFATLDKNGKVNYTLSDDTKALMAKYPKMKVENLVRKPSLLIQNNHGNLSTMLGWKLENTYKSGKKDSVILPMQEATYFNKSIFQTYCPNALDWIDLIF